MDSIHSTPRTLQIDGTLVEMHERRHVEFSFSGRGTVVNKVVSERRKVSINAQTVRLQEIEK